MVADKCSHCNKGIRRAGGFSGSYYPVDRKLGDTEGEAGEAKVHLECFEAYQAEPAKEEEEEGGAAAPDSAAETAADTAAVATPVADAEIDTRADNVAEAGTAAGAAKGSS